MWESTVNLVDFILLLWKINIPRLWQGNVLAVCFLTNLSICISRYMVSFASFLLLFLSLKKKSKLLKKISILNYPKIKGYLLFINIDIRVSLRIF